MSRKRSRRKANIHQLPEYDPMEEFGVAPDTKDSSYLDPYPGAYIVPTTLSWGGQGGSTAQSVARWYGTPHQASLDEPVATITTFGMPGSEYTQVFYHLLGTGPLVSGKFPLGVAKEVTDMLHTVLVQSMLEAPFIEQGYLAIPIKPLYAKANILARVPELQKFVLPLPDHATIASMNQFSRPSFTDIELYMRVPDEFLNCLKTLSTSPLSVRFGEFARVLTIKAYDLHDSQTQQTLVGYDATNHFYPADTKAESFDEEPLVDVVTGTLCRLLELSIDATKPVPGSIALAPWVFVDEFTTEGDDDANA